nr:GGDEF domain-containing protein [Solimonas soli]
MSRANATPGATIEPRDVQQLEAMARGQRGRYRLSPALESEFQADMRLSARTARICVALLTFALFVSAPLWTRLIFATPVETAGLMTVIELAVMAPLFGLLTFVVARYPTSEGVEWFLIGAFVVEMVTVEIVRYISRSAGFEIEPSIAVTVPVALMGLARLRVRHCVMFIAVYVIAMLGLARLWPDSGAHRSATAWLMEVLLLGMVLLSVVLMRLSLRRQWASTRLLEMMAYRDALTGLSNRRAFEDHYDAMLQALPRGEHGTLLFALIDLDHFKALNDHYGHDYGDGALAEVGVALAGLARRPLDMAARIGGEEFALLLYDCAADAAAARAQAIIEAISGLGIEHVASPTGTLTCSAGVVVVSAKEPEALSDAYRRADECLYQAKRRGRNTYRLLV